jgi:DNA polymerase-3 subunit delta
MPVFDRNSLKKLLREIADGKILPVYLFHGDRYLCRQAADAVAGALCAENGTVHPIDGDTEDFNATIARLRSFSLLPGRQVYRVNGTRLFFSRKVAKSLWNKADKARDKNPDQAAQYLRAMMAAGGLDPNDSADDPAGLSAARWKKKFGFAKPSQDLKWTALLLERNPGQTPSAPAAPAGDPSELLQGALEAGIPENNILMLVAEEADKRKKLFKFIKNTFAVIDLAVDTGSGARARKDQQAVLREQVARVLEEMGKTMAPQVVEQLLERVGFHPVAVVMETEKLALYTGERRKITIDDLNAVVGRTRQEALYELTQAIGERNLDRALLITSRLQENGIHALAVLATLRNYTRGLLLFRALGLREEYGFRPNMAPNTFQQQCLPRLKEAQENGPWKKELSGHPFAVYMQFKTASSFSLSRLKSWLAIILAADMRLKGTSIEAATILQHVILSMLTETGKGTLQNRHDALHY